MTPTLLPPGPRSRLLCTRELMTDPIGALHRWRDRHGDTFSVPLLFGDRVITCDPELVRQIHANRETGVFQAGITDAFDPLFGDRSLLRVADEAHARDRKLMLPPFHGERVRGWARTIADIGRRAFTGRDEVRAIECTRRATLEVILRLVFGVRDDARVASFQAAIEAWIDALHPSFIFIPALARDWFGLSRYARYRRQSERLDTMLYAQIAATRAAPSPGDDVLAMLVHARHDDGTAMDDRSLRDNLRTLLFAGHDTTAIILAWALWFVHRDPAVLTRLRGLLDELGPDVDPERLAQIPYLNAVIDETLRCRPINSETQRHLSRPYTLGPWQIPAGVMVCVSQVVMHHRDDLWDHPERFAPERFLGAPPSPAIYTPFGGGDRRCLGATFARYEAAIVLATALREFEFELLDPQETWGRGKLILEPLGGVRVRVRPRERPPAS